MRLLVVALLAALLSGCAASTSRPPNIVLICVEGCRADHLGAWGYARDPSPNLDRLAREGVSFHRSYSQANESLFSHASLFASRYPAEIAPPTSTHFAIPSDLPTLPKLLKARGYRTAAFTGGGQVRHEYGFGDGYDTYFDGVPFGAFFHSVPRAVAWLDQGGDGPFFMFLHGYDCHRPYRKPAVFSHLYAPGYAGDADRYLVSPQVLDGVYRDRFYEDFAVRVSHARAGDHPGDPTSYVDLERLLAAPSDRSTPLASGDVPHIVAHYDSAITYADTWLGLFLANLARHGFDRSNTLVVVLADHGEDLMEHGTFNHRLGLQIPNVHVPLIFWGAGVEAGMAGRRYDFVTQNLDVAPTILALAGATALPGSRGIDLSEFLRNGPPSPPDRPAYAEGILGMTTVLDRGHQLIARGAVPGTAAMVARIEQAKPADNTLMLYDLRRDPRETRNLVGTREGEIPLEQLARLLLTKESLVASHRGPAGHPALDGNLRRALREHGYWQ